MPALIHNKRENCKERIRYFTNAIARKNTAIERAQRFYYPNLSVLKEDKKELEAKLKIFKDRLKKL